MPEMNASTKRKIIDTHLHLYDHRQNRHDFLERVDPIFQALVEDYSALPRRYLLEN
jgi:predicted TIM-barrel fold metal-dependent hydrolase